ncbi:ADP-dependent ribose-1-phosphate kinase [Candidatus Lokiarchaeum ossiferum]|uniref:ADP-dependent ribose-1-phosphate kinase n=1 Tax=Candidatus Lokiarchaeum ossiferum TaxID=2951803 RepID=A0ABY6HPM3_9ARCH|nr:ADP-dependent ribose-1-phosphate kinase [Candidatus Lokiarchaeum sp. B-35]
MGYDIMGIGEVVVDWVATVDHFPEPDEKIDSKTQNLFSGGVTANYCVAAARLGAKVSFFGAIGSDDHGNFLKADFISEKIDCQNLLVKANCPTPVNFIFVVEKTGEKVIIQSPYMHTTVPSIESFQEKILSGVKLVHSTGIYPEITLRAFRYARKHNIITSFDLEKQIAVWGVAKLKPILENVDILLPNKMGAMELTNTNSPLDAAKIFIQWGIKTIVITLGEEGALAVTKDRILRFPAKKIKPVDTTGAGDTFCAAFGYAYGILSMPLDKAVQYANAAAFLKIQHLGARSGMPSSSQVEQLLIKEKLN